MFDIQENLKKLPDKPGVYLYRDEFGQVIYVGKAISLKNRVRQYFQSGAKENAKTKALVENIDEFEYIVTASELEALVLENNLIKKHQPKYNILLRDDKTYPYIKVTLNEEYPRIIKTRRVINDGAKYFGPYTDVKAVNETIDLLNRTTPVKKCSAIRFPKNYKPCLNFHMGLCYGICQGNEGNRIKHKYDAHIDNILGFLQGKNNNLVDELKEKMERAAENMDFEKAAEYRDNINALTAMHETQKVVLASGGDIDVIVCNHLYGMIFFVREGKLLGRETYELDASEGDHKGELATAFIKQYYGESQFIPKEILVEKDIVEQEIMEEWLSGLRGSGVKVYVPQKGDKKALIDMAWKNIQEMNKYYEDRRDNQNQRLTVLENTLQKAVGKHVSRLESYDISHTGGEDSVGAMVVFQGGKPMRRDYRKFKIKTIEGANDYASLQEVIYRRFKRGLSGDDGFSQMPDLLLIDGGEKQVNAVKEMLSAMKVDILTAGMVKDDKHRTRGLVVEGKEINLREEPVLFKYIGTIQEEVHRFAIGYHQSLRNKSMKKSLLDEISGIGEKRKSALFTHFGSIDAMRNATVEELTQAEGMTKPTAEKVKKFFEDKANTEE